MTNEEALDVARGAAITQYTVEVSIPLLADGSPAPSILGTGTLFTHEDRYFIVTAAHIMKTDPNDPCSADIDLTLIAVPKGRSNAGVVTLGSISVHRPLSPCRVDVLILELKDGETISTLKKGWRFLGFDAVTQFPLNARFVLSGFPLEGVNLDGRNLRQSFLTLITDPLNYTPEVKFPEPSVDRFFLLQNKAHLLDGSLSEIPNLKGLSGASLWAYVEPPGIWTPSQAIKVIAVQSSCKRGEWIRCTDWAAVRYIFDHADLS